MDDTCGLTSYGAQTIGAGGAMQPRIPNFSELITADVFKRRLRKLNSICSAFGQSQSLEHRLHVSSDAVFKAEGGIFYGHLEETSVDSPPEPARAFKAINYLFALNNKRRILEIGFNAGHSALLCLSAFPTIRYVGVDICEHGYTRECAAFLSETFKGRFTLLEGDSRDVLPYLATHHADATFDILHVDGGHGHVCCRSDISNCIRIAKPGSTILLDDTAAEFIRNVFAEFAGLGFIAQTDLGGAFHSADQLLAHVLRTA